MYRSSDQLESFWQGTGFSQPGEVQELCYQLSQILLRLWAAEYRPRWFGFDRSRQYRLLAFLPAADFRECGELAAQEHLQFGLVDLATRFLGPGDWTPATWRCHH